MGDRKRFVRRRVDERGGIDGGRGGYMRREGERWDEKKRERGGKRGRGKGEKG